MKKFLIKFASIVIILIFLTTNFTYIFATSKSQLNSQKSELQDKIDEAKEELEEVEATKTKALKEIEKLTEQISTYEDEIDDLEAEISNLNSSIKEAQNNLNKATEKYNEQEKLLNERLVTLYEAGETTYLDVLLSSEGITDFISNYFLVSEIATYDTELLEKIEKQKQEIENAKKILEESKSKVEIARKNKETKSNALKASKTAKNEQVSKLSEEEKKIQNDIDEYERDKRAVQSKLAAIARAEAAARKSSGSSSASVVVSNPSSAGYIFPVSGCSKANIRNKNYPSYSGHTGVDVNIGVEGKSVVAVKAGTVVISEALKKSNGEDYRSYGEYVVISHNDGTMTLYAHMKAGSRRVSVNQSVSQGQVLGTVGSTGNSTGTHLHFEVRVDGRPVNPLPYLP